MMPQLSVSLLLLALGFLTLFGAAELLYHRFGVRSEWTRKIVHAGTGLITLLFPLVLESHWQVLLLCGSFLVLLLASSKFGWLPSINGIDRKSYGSLLYPVIVYLCFLIYATSGKGLILFYMPVLILAICDPVAALVGKQFPWGIYHPWGSLKTLSGSLAFLVSASAVCLALFYGFEPARPVLVDRPGSAALVPVVATICEALSVRGTDNFTVPAGTIIALQLIL